MTKIKTKFMSFNLGLILKLQEVAKRAFVLIFLVLSLSLARTVVRHRNGSHDSLNDSSRTLAPLQDIIYFNIAALLDTHSLITPILTLGSAALLSSNPHQFAYSSRYLANLPKTLALGATLLTINAQAQTNPNNLTAKWNVELPDPVFKQVRSLYDEVTGSVSSSSGGVSILFNKANTIAYITASSVGLMVVNISNRSSPFIEGVQRGLAYRQPLILSLNEDEIILRLADTEGNLINVNVSNASLPFSKKEIVHYSGTPKRVICKKNGDVAFVFGINILFSVNISNSTPYVISNLTHASLNRYLYADPKINQDETSVYIGSQTGLCVFNVSNPASLVFQGNISLRDNLSVTLNEEETLAYIASYYGVGVVNISGPVPHLKAIDTTREAFSLTLSARGSLVFTTNSGPYSSLFLEDRSNPDLPVTVNEYKLFYTTSYKSALTQDEKFVLLASQNGAIELLAINYSPYATVADFGNNRTNKNTVLNSTGTYSGVIYFFDNKAALIKPSLRTVSIVNSHGQVQPLPLSLHFNKTNYVFNFTLDNWLEPFITLHMQLPWNEFFAKTIFTVNASARTLTATKSISVSPSSPKGSVTRSEAITFPPSPSTTQRDSHTASSFRPPEATFSQQKRSASLSLFSPSATVTESVSKKPVWSSQVSTRTVVNPDKAITNSPLESLLPAASAEVVTQVATVSTSVGGLFSTVLANKATTTDRIAAIARCAWEEDDFKPNPLLFPPSVPLSLGGGEPNSAAMANGAIVSTTGLMALIFATLIATGSLRNSNKTGNIHKVHKVASVFFALMMSYYGPNVMEIATISASHFDDNDKSLAIGAMGFWSALLVWAGYQVFKRSSPEVEGIELSPLYEPTRDFNDKILRALVFEDIAVANVMAILSGIKPDFQSCSHIASAMVVVSVAHLAYLAKFHPYKSRLEQWGLLINSLVQLALAALSLATTYRRDSDILLQSLGAVQLGAFSLLYILVALMTANEISDYCKKRNQKSPQLQSSQSMNVTPLLGAPQVNNTSLMSQVSNPLAILNVPVPNQSNTSLRL
jgi:hypothetical protein